MKKDLHGEPNRIGNLYLLKPALAASRHGDGPIEEVHILLLREDELEEAEAFVASCEACSDFGEITFDYLLDAVTGSDPSNTEYLLPRPARCPCGNDVQEKTLISPM